MITLLNASRSYQGRKAEARVILAPTSLHLGSFEKVGILAPRGTGKSTLARLFTGVDLPSGGKIIRSGRISWPLGFAGGLHPDLTVLDNLDMTARLLGEDRLQFIGFCDAFAQLGSLLDAKMSSVSPGERALIAYACSIAVACDTYIADDMLGVGLDEVRAKCEAMLERRLQTAGLIFLTSNPRYMSRFCDRYFCLLRTQLIETDDLAAATEAVALTAGAESMREGD